MRIQKDLYKILVILVLLTGACSLVYFFHIAREIDTVFMHLFYLPIVLASYWFRRKGISVAVFLAMLLVLSDILTGRIDMFLYDCLRSFIFIFISLGTVIFKEYIDEAKKELYKEKELQHSILNAVPYAIIGLRERQIIFANKGVKTVFGLDPQELVGKTTKVLYRSEKDFKKIGKLFYKKLEKKNVYRHEFPCRHKNGKNILCMVSAAIMGDKLKNKEITAVYQDITKEKQTTEKLKESELKYRNVVIHSNQFFYIHDTKNTLTYVSPQSKEMFGYAPEEMKIKWTSLVTKNPINEVGIKLTEKALKTGIGQKPYFLEAKGKGGKIILIEVNESPIKNNNGRVIGMAGVLVDITEKKKREEKLKESEEKFRLLAENTLDCIWQMNEDLIFTYVNPSVFHMFGSTQKEWIGSSLADHCSAEDAKKILKVIAETLKKKGDHSAVFKTNIRHKNGKIIPVEIHGKIVFDKNKNPAGFCGTTLDITERKQATEKLKASKETLQKREKELSDILDNATMHIWAFDGKRFIYFSKEWYRYTGQNKKLFLNIKEWIKLIHPDDSSRTIREWQEVLDSKEKYKSNFRIKGKNGKYKLFHSYAIPIYNKNGKFLYYQGYNTDITNLKHAKEEIKSLKELDKMKDDFLNIASHELRSPLTVIIGMNEMLNDKVKKLKNDDCKKYSDIIYSESFRLRDIVEQLLTVARFEGGRINFQIEKFDLKDLVSSMLPSLEMLTNKTRSKIDINIKEKKLVITSDKKKIIEVIYNFVDNAVKYGAKKQTIKILAAKYKKDQIKIEVLDQGEGIPPKLQKKLFSKFERLDTSASKSQKGTGLGLYICKLIINKLDGKIGVESVKGKGSSFYFILPIDKKNNSNEKQK